MCAATRLRGPGVSSEPDNKAAWRPRIAPAPLDTQHTRTIVSVLRDCEYQCGQSSLEMGTYQRGVWYLHLHLLCSVLICIQYSVSMPSL